MERYFISRFIDMLPSITEENIEDILKGSFEMLVSHYRIENIGLYAFDQKALDADMVKTPRRNKGNGLVKEIIVVPRRSSSEMVSIASKSMYVSKPFNYTHQDTSLVSRMFPVLATSDTASISFCDTIPTGQFARLGVLMLTYRVGNIPDEILGDLWEDKFPFRGIVTLYLIRRLSSHMGTPENNLSASCSNEFIVNGMSKADNVPSDHISSFLTELSGVLCSQPESNTYAIPKILVSFSSLIKRSKREIDWSKSSYVDYAVIRNRVLCYPPSSKTHYYIFTLWEDLGNIIDAIASLYLHPDVKVGWASTKHKSRRPKCSSRSIIPKHKSKHSDCSSKLSKSIIPKIDISMTKGYNRRNANNDRSYVSVYNSLIPKIDLSQTKGYKKRKTSVTKTPRTYISQQKRKIIYSDNITISFSGDMAISRGSEPFIFETCINYIESALAKIKGTIKVTTSEVVIRIPSVDNLSKVWWWESIVLKSSYRKSAIDVVITIHIDDPSKEDLACDVFNIVSAWGCRVRLLHTTNSSNSIPVVCKKHIIVSIGSVDRDIKVQNIDDLQPLFIQVFT